MGTKSNYVFVSGRISKGYNQKGESMKEYTIAEILHYAADKCLASKKHEYWSYGGDKQKFSCCAVDAAIHKMYNDLPMFHKQAIITRVHIGLSNMGCPVDSTQVFDDEVTINYFIEENQQARYAWLKFAAMMAEEQGV
jgi:hypothetical protein